MKRLSKFLFTTLLIALVAMLAGAVIAQDVGAGEGGTIIESTFSDVPTFNPITSGDSASSDVIQWMYPTLFGVNPETLAIEPMQAGAMAASWEWDDTGTKLTVNLRQDVTWSDGTAITANDFMYAFNIIKSGLSSSPRTDLYYELDDGTKGGGSIFDIEMVDDYTLVFTVGTAAEDDEGNLVDIAANCNAIVDIVSTYQYAIPSHDWDAHFGDNYAQFDDDPYYTGPTQGVFTDPLYEAGVQTSLVADQNYADAGLGHVVPGEWLYLQLENQTVEYERFLAGDVTITGIAAANQNELRELAADGSYQVIEYPQDGMQFMSMNVADPTNPQDGLDADGNRVDQGVHPILGDPAVRRAFAHAINVDEMIGTRPNAETGEAATGILEGNGFRALASIHPMAIPLIDLDLEPPAFDLDLAAQMLTDAGWVDEDGDGVRECHGCATAEDGTIMEFELVTNAGNTARERIGTTIQANLEPIGVRVNFQAIEWGSLLSALYGQEYDALVIGFGGGLPNNPAGLAEAMHLVTADRVGSGFNMASWSSAEFEDLVKQAASVPGCDTEERAELYRQAFQVLLDEQPYVWLYHGNSMVAVQGNVENFDPYPYATQWNIDTWAIQD